MITHVILALKVFRTHKVCHYLSVHSILYSNTQKYKLSNFQGLTRKEQKENEDIRENVKNNIRALGLIVFQLMSGHEFNESSGNRLESLTNFS